MQVAYLEEAAETTGRSAAAAVGDLNNDGLPDMYIANGMMWPGRNDVFINTGNGTFAPWHAASGELANREARSKAIIIADLNGAIQVLPSHSNHCTNISCFSTGDGLSDAFVANQGSNDLFFYRTCMLDTLGAFLGDGLVSMTGRGTDCCE
eukprot:SAG31_NODE_2111_length_6426_cov_4.423295_7_plen_151_part_00